MILNTVHNNCSIYRGFNFATCLEGALKVKELTYMHSEGIQVGLADDILFNICNCNIGWRTETRSSGSR